MSCQTPTTSRHFRRDTCLAKDNKQNGHNFTPSPGLNTSIESHQFHRGTMRAFKITLSFSGDCSAFLDMTSGSQQRISYRSCGGVGCSPWPRTPACVGSIFAPDSPPSLSSNVSTPTALSSSHSTSARTNLALCPLRRGMKTAMEIPGSMPRTHELLQVFLVSISMRVVSRVLILLFRYLQC